VPDRDLIKLANVVIIFSAVFREVLGGQLETIERAVRIYGG
jgi:hypothetical protein